MSNETMTFATPANAPANAQVEVAAEVAAEPKKSSLVYRLLALLVIGLCAGILLLDISTFVSAWEIKTQPIIMDSINALLDSKAKMSGFLPVFFVPDKEYNLGGLVANLLPYILVVCIAVAIVLAIVALISGKGGVLRASLFFVAFGATLYFLAVYALSAMYTGEKTFDVIVTAFAGGAVLVAFLATLCKLGKKSWLWLVQFVLSIAVIVLFTMSVFYLAIIPGEALSDTYSLIAIVCLALILVNAMITFWRPSMGIVRAIIQLVLAVATVAVVFIQLKDVLDLVFEVSMTEIILLIVAAVIALAQLIIAIVTRPREEEIEEPVEDEFAGFRKETIVEAYTYDGGPVAGVEVAEEVNPTVAAINAINNPDLAAQSTVASLLGNGFDPFLISLTNQEKEEFIDLYVLKVKGLMPEIPGYVVGGDNKDFFNKVFIYLGQYREKIPGTLLNKMYNFSMKI